MSDTIFLPFFWLGAEAETWEVFVRMCEHLRVGNAPDTQMQTDGREDGN